MAGEDFIQLRLSIPLNDIVFSMSEKCIKKRRFIGAFLIVAVYVPTSVYILLPTGGIY